MAPEIEDQLTVEEIKAVVKEKLPSEKMIRVLIDRYDQLSKEAKLTVDSYYFLRAANVSDDEAQMFYFFWGKGERVYPEVIDDQHPIFCPVHRMRLKTLGEKAQEHHRYVIWRE